MTTKIDTTKFGKVDMKIEEYITTRAHHGRRGSPTIPSGTKLYLIKYVNKPGYFTYGYMKRSDAESCIQNMKENETDNEFYYLWNRVSIPEDVMHVSPRN